MSEAQEYITELSLEQKRALLQKLLQQKQAGHAEAYPLSYGQQALWFLHQLAPESAVYNEPLIWRIRRDLNVSDLERALQLLIERHPILRTVYTRQDGKLMQKELKQQTVDFTHKDASSWSQEELNTYLTTETNRPFDLEHGPIFRVHVLKRAQSDYLLMLLTHHIAIDGWSYMVLMDELSKLYAAINAQQPITLPAPKIHYRDYVYRQQALLAGAEGEKLWTYWQKQLEGPLPVLQLPLDHPRPSTQTFSGATYAFTLNQQLSHQLKALAASEGVTLYTLLLAAFQVLLYRYSGQDDILISSPSNGRTQTEFEGLVGYLVNPIVLRARLDGQPSFRAFLSKTHTVVVEALEHQDFPFPLLVNRLQPHRDPSRAPLCDVAFIMQQLNRHALALDPTTRESGGAYAEGATGTYLDLGVFDAELVHIEQHTTKFDLELEMIMTGDILSGSLQYNTSLFEAATIANFATHFQTLLHHVVADPDQSIATIPLLPTEQRQQLLVDWNATSVEYPQHLCLHEHIERQVEQCPDAVAITFEDHTLSYHELNQRANQLAHYLQTLGVGPEVLVGICMERSLELIIGLLGIMKAGGAYVPLDPAYPESRLRFMLEDAEVSLLLTQQHLLPRIPQAQVHTICVDHNWSTVAEQPGDNLKGRTTPDNLAYMIYTSGSTGQPKGAMNTHRGICNRLLWMQDAFQLSGLDRVVQKTPFSFDVSVWEFFWPLMVGAHLVIARPGGHQDAHYLARFIMTQSITTIHFVPSMLRLFLDAPQVQQCQSLRHVICSGEALTPQIQEQFYNLLEANLSNLYGPTEAAIDVTSWTCQRGQTTHTVPIGYPIANTQLYVLDMYMQPVPPGVAGELYIGGVNLARGYHHRPELTAEKFVCDPFSAQPGARLYRTGDLARYLHNGVIEFLGRIDHQVKVRGFRIELGEIEASLVQHPTIRESAVQVFGHTAEDKALVAYVVAEGQPPSSTELRQFLQARLPEYMVPSTFIFLNVLPLSPNGKLDRRALPAPAQQRRETATEYVAPTSQTERTITQIWKDVLRLDHVGIQDNFFELGGNSLLMGEIQHRLSTALQRDIALTTLFRYPTIKTLAEHLEQQQSQPSSLQQGYTRASNRREQWRRLQEYRTRTRSVPTA